MISPGINGTAISIQNRNQFGRCGAWLWLVLCSLMCGGIVPAGRAQTPQPVYVINVLVLYTPQAAAGAGGATAIQGQINQAVLEASTVFQNSQVNARVRLVATSQINYTESGSVSNDLARLRNPADPVFKTVPPLRKQYAADLVCLVTETGSDQNFAGLPGPSAENAFSIIRQPFLTGSNLFPVALSFNFGCQLERPYATGTGAFPYGYGYSIWADTIETVSWGGTVELEYSTVEGFSGIRLPYFSNPNIQYDGQPLGVPPGQPNSADNALVLNQTAPIVAGFHGAAVTTDPPLIRIDYPQTNSYFWSGGNINITGSASDADGKVASVMYYYDDTNKIAAVVATPFDAVWTNPPIGVHTLKAIATDNQSATTVSAPTTVTVLPGNGFFAGRTPISLPATIQEPNNLAAIEAGDPYNNGNPPQNPLWWTFTAKSNSLVAITISSNSIPLNLTVFTGTNLNSLSLMASNGSLLTATSPLIFSVTAGTSYQIVADGQTFGQVSGPGGGPQGQASAVTGLDIFSVAIPVAPANDNFAKRTVLKGASFAIQADNTYATEEPGEPNPGNASLWWSWTAPASGDVTIAITSASGTLFAGVYAGNDLATLTGVASTYDYAYFGFGNTLTFYVQAGSTYQIAFDDVLADYNPYGLNSFTGPFTWTLSLTASPSNDNFANRTPISGSWINLTNSNVAATLEPNEPYHAGEASIWWSWTAPASGQVTIASATGNFVDVYTGNSLVNLVPVNPEVPENFSNTNTFVAKAGVTYAIAASGQEGPVGLNLVLSTVTLTKPAAGAVYAVGQSIPLAVSTTKNDGTIQQVQYSVDGTPAAVITKPPFQTSMQVSGGASLTLTAAATDTSGHTRVSPPVNITVVNPPPINDNFANRTKLQGTWLLVTNSNLGATAEPGEPDFSSIGATNSIWWEWTAPTNGWVTIDSPLTPVFGLPAGYTVYNPVGVFTGSSLSQLAVIVYGVGPLAFPAMAGVTYDIGVVGAPGNVVLKLSLSDLRIVQPVDGSTFTNGATIALQAQPSFTDGTVREVSFYADGGVPLGTVSNAPFVFTWTNVLAANYSLAAVATDTQGRDHASAPVSVSVRLVNDSVTNAIVLAGSWISVTNPIGAEEFVSDPIFSPTGYGDTFQSSAIWWQWTAPGSGTVTLSALNVYASVQVFTGDNTGGLTMITNYQNLLYSGSPLPSYAGPLNFEAAAGQTYYIEAAYIDTSEGLLPANGMSIQPEINLQLVLSGLSITSPVDGAVIACSTNLVVSAVENDIGEPISQVEFFYSNSVSGGPVSLGMAAQPPYSVVWTNPPGGSFQVMAVAAGTDGHSRSAPPVNITVLPSNDNFANRTVLPGNPTLILGTETNSTAELGEPNVNPSDGHTVWYSWTAPVTAAYTLDLNQAVADGGPPSDPWRYPIYGEGAVYLYTGDSLADLVLVDSSSMGIASQLTFQAVAGTTYQIQISADIPSDFSLTFHPAPANDDFASAILLTGDSVTVTNDTTWATWEPGEPQAFAAVQYGSVWYYWTAPANGTVSVTALSGGPGLEICTGSSVSNLSVVASASTVYGPANSGGTSFNAMAGTTYFIAVDSGSGPFALNLNFAPGPNNDYFSDRTVLSGMVVNVQGTLSNATLEVGEPSPTDYIDRSVWYSWTAPVDGHVRIQLPQLYDAVYTGSVLTNLTLVTYSSNDPQPAEFDATAGQTYQIQVFYPYSNGTNDFTLSLAVSKVAITNITNYALFTAGTNIPVKTSTIDLDGTVTNVQFFLNSQLVSTTGIRPFSAVLSNVPPGLYILEARAADDAGNVTTSAEVHLQVTPANDDFANRIVLAGRSGTLTSSNNAATTEPGEQLPPYARGYTTWWSWTAPASGTLTFSNNWQTPYAVYSDSSFPGLGTTQSQTIAVGGFESALISVFEGTSLTNLSLYANNIVHSSVLYDPYTTVLSEFSIPVTGGQTYQISLDQSSDGFSVAIGPQSVNYWFGPGAPMPPNDNFAGRTQLTSGIVATNGTTVGASSQLTDPDLAAGPDAPSVWYAWTAPASGPVTVSATAKDGQLLTVVYGVFAGSSFASLSPIITPSLPSYFYGYGTFYALAGTTYQIEVATPVNQECDFTLNINGPSAPVINPAKPVRLSNGNYVIQVTGSAGESFVIQSSADQQHWTTIDTDTLLASSLLYTNTPPKGSPALSFRVLPLDTVLNNQPFQMFGPGWQPGNGFSLNLSGNSGQPFLIQTSTNLVDWYNLTSGILTNNAYNFIDYDAPIYPRRFYRAAAQ